MVFQQVGLVVVPFSVAAASDIAFISLPLLYVRHHMRLLVFFQVALLRETLSAEAALEWFNTFVHASVIKNIPSTSEFFISVFVGSNINCLILR